MNKRQIFAFLINIVSVAAFCTAGSFLALWLEIPGPYGVAVLGFIGLLLPGLVGHLLYARTARGSQGAAAGFAQTLSAVNSNDHMITSEVEQIRNIRGWTFLIWVGFLLIAIVNYILPGLLGVING